MSTLETYELLTAYIRKELNDNEVLKVENLLQNDASFKEEYQDLLLIESLAIDSILSAIQNLCNQEFDSLQKKSKRINYYVIGAIASAILIGTCVYFSSKKEEKTIQKTSLAIQKTEDLDTKVSEKTIIHTEESAPKSIKNSPKSENKTPLKSITLVDSLQVQPKIANPQLVPESILVANNKPKDKIENTAIDCSKDKVDWSLETSPSCQNEANGTVILRSGNLKSITEKSIFSSDNHAYNANNLSKGTYTYTILDNRNCSYSKTFDIKNKLCAVNLKINPSLNESLSFENEEGLFHVKTLSGESYFEKNLSQSDDFSWDGKSTNGAIKYGVFIFYIEFEGKQTKFGTITILQ
jgi:hypothetical protein